MEKKFWEARWQSEEIGFHLPSVHSLLKEYLPTMALDENATLFLPLCGKTLDIAYLLSLEYQVVGVELSERAVKQLFLSLQVAPEIQAWAGGKVWRAQGLTVFQGDVFTLTPNDIGAVDAIYDRAALVALPEGMRQQYASHLVELTYAAPQLLISFEYQQSKMNGPPFSVEMEKIADMYADLYELIELSRTNILEKFDKGRASGLDEFIEVAWRLVPQQARTLIGEE